ncbi:MAG: hypothetical protein IJ532_05175 [Alphaproteobacteria bacterium]|nr:hypothetical protein [Alphaproteobacteria bacterium]
MSFTFFAFDSRFFWEDVYNYNGWIIQLNVRTLKYRLLDSYSVCRESGSFEQCKETLLKYIYACEMDDLCDNTVVILHGFGGTRASAKIIGDGLKGINANIIPLSYATFRRGIGFHSNILAQMLQNIEVKGKLYIINIGAACLITRKLLSESDNFRRYNIERVLDVSPMNAGSDLAELFMDNRFFRFLLGPMLKDIATPNALNLEKLPEEIDHGLIFAQNKFTLMLKKLLARFESFPSENPKNERTYAQKIKNIDLNTWFSLKDEQLLNYCRNFVTTGDFMETWSPFVDNINKVKRKTEDVKSRKIKK